MRKLLSVCIVFCIITLGTTGCSSSNKTQPAEVVESTAVNIDLSVLSGTAVYSAVYNIMNSPQQYLGQTIRIQGIHSSSFSNETQKFYHFAIISDATACCQQGMEFIWTGHTSQNDYPDDGTEIVITGTFQQYSEIGQIYYYLAVSDLTVV